MQSELKRKKKTIVNYTVLRQRNCRSVSLSDLQL